VLDGTEARFDCYVRAVDGAVATLGQLGGVVAELNERLSPGAIGFAVTHDGGGQLALRGVATLAPDGVDGFSFVVLDGLTPAERRGAPRTPLGAVVNIHGVSGDPSHAGTTTVTADISQSGALLERRTGLDLGVRVALELVFDGFPAPVHSEAEVVRDTLTHVGVKFTTIDERDRARLAVILAHNRRQLGLT
jgi:PilZ domain